MKNCPNCKVSLQGDPIPQEYLDKGYYQEGLTHYGREIGIDGGYMGIYDGIVAFRCPDCDYEWPVSPADWGMDMFDKYQKVKNGEQIEEIDVFRIK